MNFLPKGIDPKEFLNLIREIGWKTNDLLRSYSQISENSSDFKKLEINELSTGPVTSADLAANKLIIEGIKEKYPQQKWSFLSEENGKGKNNELFLNKDWVWIIDPLDGTRDFINNTGEYATHISLLFRRKNIFGSVFIPSREELWFYLEGFGSWLELKNSQKKTFKYLNEKKIDDLSVAISKSHFHKELELIINKLNISKMIGMGSIGYKITSIIRGEADLYISYSDKDKSCPKDWDMAAPEAIIRGFGGRFTDLNGSQLSFLEDESYSQGGILVASMSNKHSEICNKIKIFSERN